MSKKINLKIFEIVQINLASLGFTPNQQQNNNRQWSFRQNIFVILCSIQAILYVFHIIFEANDNTDYINLIIPSLCDVGCTIAFISIIFKSDKLFNGIELLAKELTDRSEANSASRAIHEKTNRRVEQMSKIIHFAFIYIGVPGYILPKFIFSYFIYFTTDAGNDAFDLPFPQWFPFDWKNPIGYFVVIVWQIIGTYLLLLFMACMLPYTLGAFLIALSLTKDWKHDLRTLDEMVKSKQSNPVGKVTELVRSHTNFKQLINDFTDVVEVTICVAFMCCFIILCVVMIVVQVEILSMDTVEPVVLWTTILWGCATFAMLFFTCELGEQFTNIFAKLNYKFDRLNWYLFPIEIKRILPTILVGVQQPMAIKCLGLVFCSRDQFKKVVNAVYKSFHLLREILN